MYLSGGLFFQELDMSRAKVRPLDCNAATAVRPKLRVGSSAKLAFVPKPLTDAAGDLLNFVGDRKFGTVLADPPWQFQNRTGKVAPEHKRLARYGTMTLEDIKALPVAEVAASTSHLYLWVPNALLPDGIAVMRSWGFQYKSNLVWHKIRKDGGSDGRGVGFYFRNVTELILFGVRGKNARTLKPGRTQVNYLSSRKREHSRKPDEQYALIEACSPGPFLELFARGDRKKWIGWGNQADESYEPTWKTYSNHSQSEIELSATGD
jgi:N6-adenosine-specific RNA methylase IME4